MRPAAEHIAIQLCELPRPVDVSGAFARLRCSPYPWLLDSSSRPGEPSLQLARYSFAGSDPRLVLRSRGRSTELEWRRPVEVPGGRDGGAREGDPLEILRGLMPARPTSIGMTDGACAGLPDPLPPFLGGAVAVFGYELAEVTEPVELRARNDLDLPDLVCLFVDSLLVVDHSSDRAFAVGMGAGESLEAAESAARKLANSLADRLRDVEDAAPNAAILPGLGSPGERRRVLEAPLPERVEASMDEARYVEAVEEIREQIGAGNVYQANLTQRIDLDFDSNDSDDSNDRTDPEVGAPPHVSDTDLAWSLYRALRGISPAPFASYLELPEVSIVGSSPERFLALDAEGRVESRPIKGTRPRGATAVDDARLAKELAESVKDRAENLMIVDLVRNDLGRVCESGSIDAPELMAIEAYATVFQMVSSVVGRLRAECDAIDLIRATFPPGSMTGAPKIAAMRIIDDLEPVRRGIYSGAIGYLDVRGGLDLSVVIRTLLVRGGRIHMHGGGAVVTDSDPRAEYRESLDKIRALLAAVAWVRDEGVAPSRGTSSDSEGEETSP